MMADESHEVLSKDYNEALELKKKGNEYFKQNKYQAALKSYSEALLHIGMNPSTNVSSMFGVHTQMDEKSGKMDEIRKLINEVRLSTFNNIAMVHLKQANYDKAIVNCTYAIKCNPYDFKALLRRGRAYRHLKKVENARKDLKFLQQYYKYDLQLKNELKLLQIKDFESDDTVIIEEEERAKEKEERQRAAEEAKKAQNKNGYFVYIGAAIFIMILAVIMGYYFVYN